MDPTLESMLTALIQIPFIAAFIWFAVRMSHDYRDDAKLRDQHWMEFLKLEREQRKIAMNQGMEEVKAMTEGMKELTHAIADLAKHMIQHDGGAVSRHEDLIKTLKIKDRP